MEITKEQVLDLHQHSGVTVQNHLKKWFPEAFKVGLKVGKVYKYKDLMTLIKITGLTDNELQGYGFNYEGNYCFKMSSNKYNAKNLTEATAEEWQSALIKEAKKRGYKNGNYKCLMSPNRTHVTGSDFDFYAGELRLFTKDTTICKKQNVIFRDGIWAEIIKNN